MKKRNTFSFLLLLLCAMLTFNLSAQDKKAEIKSQKKVVIVQKHVDKDGNTVIEKTIGEGAEADRILKEMAFQKGDENVDIHIIKNLKEDVEGEETERLFLFRKAGGEKVEGRIEINDFDIDITTDEMVIDNGQIQFNEEYLENFESFAKFDDWKDTKGWHYEYGGPDKTNCAALGIYTNHSKSENGVIINSLIERGGAQEAGLIDGDYITSIDGKPVNNYSSLLKVLLQYIPEDNVEVEYTREGVANTTQVTLRAWKEMPAMANTWRANVTCDDAAYENKYDFLTPVEEVTVVEEVAEEIPAIVERSFSNTLNLEDYQAFPNPSDGVIKVRFQAEEGPIKVNVIDVSGKNVFSFEKDRFKGVFDRNINLTKYGAGTYILRVIQNDRVFGSQLVVQ